VERERECISRIRALASHPWTEHLPAWSRTLDKGPLQFRRIAGSYVREDPSAPRSVYDFLYVLQILEALVGGAVLFGLETRRALLGGSLLVHDLGEIDAGDKFVFAQDGWEDRKVAELRAVERICDIARLKVADWLITLWKEFDGGGTPEARFAKAIDRCMPVLLNLSHQGGSWLENGVTYERVVGRIGPEIENGCPELWTYMKEKLEEGRRKGFFAATS
jgi:HD domain